MSQSIAKPKIKFKIIMNDKWNSPQRFIENIDSLLRYYLLSPSLNKREWGLLIEADGQPWNTRETIEYPTHIWSWFQAVLELISGKKQASVWAWEESNCIIIRDDEKISLMDTWSNKIICPKVFFLFEDFLNEILVQGKLVFALSNRLKNRLRELEESCNKYQVPSAVQDWDDLLKKTEKTETAKHELLEYRWKKLLEASEYENWAIPKHIMNALDIIAKYLNENRERWDKFR